MGGLFDIEPPDEELRQAIFKHKADSYGVEIPANVLQFLAENIKTNIRQIEGAIKTLKAIFDKEKPDIAYILTENCQKPEVVLECAKRGINVSIEKPLAVNLEEANNIPFRYPHRWKRYCRR